MSDWIKLELKPEAGPETNLKIPKELQDAFAQYSIFPKLTKHKLPLNSTIKLHTDAHEAYIRPLDTPVDLKQITQLQINPEYVDEIPSSLDLTFNGKLIS